MAIYEVEEQTRTRSIEEINLILNQAILNFEQGKKTGKYTAPYDTDHIFYRSGEAFRRMQSYISDLERELTLPLILT